MLVLEVPPTPLFWGELLGLSLGLMLKFRLLIPKRSDNFFNSTKTFLESRPVRGLVISWGGFRR